MTMQATQVKAVDAPLSILGEGPLWSVRDQALYWVDISGKKVFRLRPQSGQVEFREMPYTPGGVFEHANGGLLLVSKKGLALFDFDRNELQNIRLPGIDFSEEVFNDAACDRLGRLWVGSRDVETKNPVGSLYCVAPDFSYTRHGSGYVVSNGIGWSPDGKTFYHTDTRPGRIDACDFDLQNGTLSNRRPLITYGPDSKGRPDGCTIDAEGGIWVAEVGAWRLARYNADGSFNREIKVPVSRPTSVMFGGADLSTLYITSMRFRLTEAELADQPLAGGLFEVRPGVKGVEEAGFGGR